MCAAATVLYVYYRSSYPHHSPHFSCPFPNPLPFPSPRSVLGLDATLIRHSLDDWGIKFNALIARWHALNRHLQSLLCCFALYCCRFARLTVCADRMALVGRQEGRDDRREEGERKKGSIIWTSLLHALIPRQPLVPDHPSSRCPPLSVD